MKKLKNLKDWKLSEILQYISLIIASILILGPVYIVLVTSFKSKEEYMYGGIFDLPKSFLNFENYSYFFERSNMLQGYFNSFLVILVSLSAAVFMGSMVAYVLSRFDFLGKKLIMASFMLAVIIPPVVTEVTRFQLISGMGLFNTRLAPMLIFSTSGLLQIYIYLQFMNKIPTSLDESALINGASYPRIYWSIILPLVKPATITVIVLKGVQIYNNMFVPYLYVPKKELRLATISLMHFAGDRTAEWTVLSAGILVLLLPPVVIYLFLQRYIIAGATQGAVKE